MKNAPSKPSLSAGNKLYLYRLLKEAIGTGKQTFATKIEEALEADDLAAESLGFTSTRELLEELGDFVKLTVFKGGRVYATLVAQPEWDAALENQAKAPAKADAAAKGKSWKKKKGGKTLKAQRPKHARRPEPEPEEEPAAEADVKAVNAADTQEESAANKAVEERGTASEADAAADSAAQIAAQGEPLPKKPNANGIAATADMAAKDADSASNAPAASSDGTPKSQVEHSDNVENAAATSISNDNATASSPNDNEANRDGAAELTAPAEAPKPAITFTVVYDPDDANAGVHTFESNPHAAKAAQSAASTQNETQPNAEGTESGNGPATPSRSAGNDSKASRRPETKTSAASDSPAQRAVATAESETAHAESPVSSHERSTGPASEPAGSSARNAANEPAHVAASKPSTAPAAVPAAEPAAESKPAFDFSGYPVDFTREVFCSGNLLAELSALLPYGADALGIAGEYYWIARERGTIEAARNRASFALRYTRDGERHEATVRIRRNTSSSNFDWTIDKIESIES